MEMRGQRLKMLVLAAVVLTGVDCMAAKQGGQVRQPTATNGSATTTNGVPVVPPDFVIGVDDVLSITVYREPDFTKEAVVRPDGKISLLYINDVQAAGLTVEALRLELTKAISKFVGDPVVNVTVKTINSRVVYIIGEVAKQGPVPLRGPMTVSQLIAVAGGLTDFADRKNILIRSVRKRPDGQPWTWVFNWDEFVNRKNMAQDRELEPGDTVIVR